MTFNEQFAKNLREARLAKDMRQATLAQKIGVTHNCVSLYETAKRVPSLRTAALMSHALDVPLGDLIPCDLVSCDLHAMSSDPNQTDIFDYLEEDNDEWKH